MAKANVSRAFDATDTTKGVSIRVQPGEKPQTLPSWVIAAGVAVGAATRADTPINKPAAAGETE